MEIDPRTKEPVWALPFDQLEVGMSFFIPTNRPNIMKETIERVASELGYKVRAIVATKEKYLGVRTWRVG